MMRSGKWLMTADDLSHCGRKKELRMFKVFKWELKLGYAFNRVVLIAAATRPSKLMQAVFAVALPS